MKNVLLLVSFASLTLSSCSSDDDGVSSSGNSLNGTVWNGTGNDEGETYAFTSSSTYTFSENGSNFNGTYTFDGSEGVLTESGTDFDFVVSGNTMTVDNGDSSVYIKQ